MRRYAYILLTLAALSLNACRGLRPIEGAHREYNMHTQFDSISRDHFRFTWTFGDTIHITDSIYIDRWRIKHDSICRTDTIYVPQYYEPDDYQFCKRSAIGFYIGLAVMIMGIGFVIIGRCLLR